MHLSRNTLRAPALLKKFQSWMLLCRMKSGNPAVPVAQAGSGTPRQRGRSGDDSTEQALSLGRPSDTNEASAPLSPLGAPLSPQVARQRQDGTSPAPLVDAVSQPTLGQGQSRIDTVPTDTESAKKTTGQGQILTSPASLTPAGSLSVQPEQQQASGHDQISPALGSMQGEGAQSSGQQFQQSPNRVAFVDVPPSLTIDGYDLSSRPEVSTEVMGLRTASASHSTPEQQQWPASDSSSNSRLFSGQASGSVPGPPLHASGLSTANAQSSDQSSSPVESSTGKQ